MYTFIGNSWLHKYRTILDGFGLFPFSSISWQSLHVSQYCSHAFFLMAAKSSAGWVSIIETLFPY